MQLSNPIRPDSITTDNLKDGAVTEVKTDFDSTPLSVAGGGTGTNNGSITGPGTLTFTSGAGSSDNINYICGDGGNISWTATGIGAYMYVGFSPGAVGIATYTSPSVGSTAPLSFIDYGNTVTNFTIDTSGDVTARGTVSGTSLNVSDPATALILGGDGQTTHAKIDEVGNYIASPNVASSASVGIYDKNNSNVAAFLVDGTKQTHLNGLITVYGGLATQGMGVAPITIKVSNTNITDDYAVDAPPFSGSGQVFRANVFAFLRNVSGSATLTGQLSFTYGATNYIVDIFNLHEGVVGNFGESWSGIFTGDNGSTPTVGASFVQGNASDNYDFYVVFERLV